MERQGKRGGGGLKTEKNGAVTGWQSPRKKGGRKRVIKKKKKKGTQGQSGSVKVSTEKGGDKKRSAG